MKKIKKIKELKQEIKIDAQNTMKAVLVLNA